MCRTEAARFLQAGLLLLPVDRGLVFYCYAEYFVKLKNGEVSLVSPGKPKSVRKRNNHFISFARGCAHFTAAIGDHKV